jgi:hypothetical protein
LNRRVVVALAALLGCRGPEAVSAPVTGDHVGKHGMVLFGREKLHLSHIPMFDAPHDLQLVVEANVLSGVPNDARVFSDKLYTVAPKAKFSLTDLARGALTEMTGTIFDGNFEDGGKPLYPDVHFSVTRVEYRRPLVKTTARSASLDYLLVGTDSDPYLVHIIDTPTSFDQVVALAPAKSVQAGTVVTIEGGINDVTKRPTTGALHAATSTLQARTELSCLLAPGFGARCALPEDRQDAKAAKTPSPEFL